MSSRRLIVLLPVLLSLGACAVPTPKTSSPAAPVAVAPAMPALSASDLIGADTNRLTALLGAPDFRRMDAPAALWQYRTETCLLDLFLYQTADKPDQYALKHIAARGHGNATISGDACLTAAANAKDKK